MKRDKVQQRRSNKKQKAPVKDIKPQEMRHPSSDTTADAEGLMPVAD